jgi:hypothetical protein
MERVIFDYFDCKHKSLSIAYVHGFIDISNDIRHYVKYVDTMLYDPEFIGGP